MEPRSPALQADSLPLSHQGSPNRWLWSLNLLCSSSWQFLNYRGSGSLWLWVFSSVQSLNRVRLFATPWTAACQASLCITNSRSLLKLMSIESVIPSNHLIVCHPLLLTNLTLSKISNTFRDFIHILQNLYVSIMFYSYFKWISI